MPVHMEPYPTFLILKNDGKSDNYLVKLKLRRDTMSSMSDLYEFKMSLFENGYPEEFLLFVRYFNMNIAA